MKRLAVLFSPVILAFMLLTAACDSSKSGKDALIGRWDWSKLTIRGVTWSPLNPTVLTPGGTTVINPALITQLDPNARVAVTVTFNKDKTAVASLDAVIPGRPVVAESRTGTWSASGDQLTVRYQSGPSLYTATVPFDVSGKKLTIEISNQLLLTILDVNNADLSSLTPAQRDLLRSLSGTAEFVK